MQPNNILRLITHQTGWLNTSRALTAEELQGRVILLDFWTYCCINCIHVIPDLKYLEEKFGDKLTVIGVHSAKFKNEKDSENIRQAILRYGIHHPVVNDFDFSTWQGFGIRAWPTFVLINPKGMIETMYSGEGNREKMEHDINALLKKYDGKINTEKLPLALEESKQPPTVLSFPGKMVYVPDFRGKPALMVSDSGHNRIVVLGLDGTIIQAVGDGQAGWKDGEAKEARFNHPQGLAYNQGFLYVADTENHLLRLVDFGCGDNITEDTRVDSSAGCVLTLAGTGTQGYERAPRNAPALQTPLSSPWDVAFFRDPTHPNAASIVIAMAGTHQLWVYNDDGIKQTVSVIAGNGNESIDDGAYPNNSLSQPSGLSAIGNVLYFVDAETSSLRILANGEITTLIGTGLFDFGYKEGVKGTARMQHPLGVFADSTGVYVADSYNHSIRRYDPATGVLSDFIGHGARGKKDGAFAEAEFNEPNDIIKIGNKFYIADTNNNAIRIADLDKKTVSTLAVTEAQSRPAEPEFSGQLPNLAKMEPVDVAVNTPITITIALHKGWHINPDAPSYLALFDAAKKSVGFSVEAVKKNASLAWPALPAGSYRLQGTLYYCEDKAGAQCLLKSFDVPVTAGKDGKKEIMLKVN